MNRILFFFISGITSLATVTASVSKFLILGGSSNTAHALIKQLSVQQKPCTIFARNTDKVKTLFSQYDTIEYVEGSASEDAELLIATAKGKEYIYLGQDFPYTIWEKCLGRLVDTVIAAATKTGATIIYPGRIYKYGLVEEIFEDTEPQPNSHQGEVLEKIENQLINAAIEKKCPSV